VASGTVTEIDAELSVAAAKVYLELFAKANTMCIDVAKKCNKTWKRKENGKRTHARKTMKPLIGSHSLEQFALKR